MDNYNVITIECSYIYNGAKEGETTENKQEYPKERWKISLGKNEKGNCFILENIDQGYTEMIKIEQELYEKFILGREQDLTGYLKYAYETHRGRGDNKFAVHHD
jgi:hypothetical protein